VLHNEIYVSPWKIDIPTLRMCDAISDLYQRRGFPMEYIQWMTIYMLACQEVHQDIKELIVDTDFELKSSFMSCFKIKRFSDAVDAMMSYGATFTCTSGCGDISYKHLIIPRGN
jgi:hypothetical protein